LAERQDLKFERREVRIIDIAATRFWFASAMMTTCHLYLLHPRTSAPSAVFFTD